MKELPILFSGEMVRAILDGRKTETRRIVKKNDPRWFCRPRGDENNPWLFSNKCGNWMQVSDQDGSASSPYGMPGEHLWVRETHQVIYRAGFHAGTVNWETGEGLQVKYPATEQISEMLHDEKGYGTWCRPSIHMYRWASRITLEITEIRVERLNEITEEDSVAEGVSVKEVVAAKGLSARSAFKTLWESINGAGSWDKNPWVWVIEFKRI